MGHQNSVRKVSLEALIESGDVELPVLHPGGLASTRALAEMCHAGPGRRLLDVASGTGETACYLAANLGCTVTGLDHSAYMVQTAKRKAKERGLAVEFREGDAHDLPFEDATFDAAISECTTCALNKQRAIEEMVRVTRRGGYVGISDLYWKENAQDRIKTRLGELENEYPETLAGWTVLFERAGLQEIQTRDLSGSLAAMSHEMRKELGAMGQLRILLRVVRRWGVAALARIAAAERILRNKNLGYAIVVGHKVRNWDTHDSAHDTE